MSTWPGGEPFEGSRFDVDNDLVGALRAGLAPLHLAASAAGISSDAVDEVVGTAWNPFTGFDARGVRHYRDVVEISTMVIGWAWTEAVLVDPRPREAAFARVTWSTRKYALRLYPRLGADAEAAADDAMAHLGRLMLEDARIGCKVPAWTSPPVVERNAKWRLNTAAKKSKRSRTAGPDGPPVVSLDAYFDACGGSDVTNVGYSVSHVDDLGVEAAAWADARAILDSREAGLIDGVRAGSAREKLTLIIAAAKWVLASGTEDTPRDGELVEGSAQEIRHMFAQDPLLTSFCGLRAVAPETWGYYPEERVPLLGDLREAAETVGRGHPMAAWFAAVSTRKNELHKRGYLLHSIKATIDALLKEVADDGEDDDR